MNAILYTSNTGHTARYAQMLAEKTGLPLYTLEEACARLPRNAEIVYCGWLFASSVKGYRKAAKRFRVAAVCGVGLCDTGCLLSEVRKAISLPPSIPLFTLQGGIKLSELRGINKSMITMLTKVFASKKEKTPDDERMLYLLTHEDDYVREENLAAVLAWYEQLKER